MGLSHVRDLTTAHGDQAVSFKVACPTHIPDFENAAVISMPGKGSVLRICGRCSESVTIQVKRTQICFRAFVSIVMSHRLQPPQHMTIDLFSSVLHSYRSPLNYDECLHCHGVKLGQVWPRSAQYFCHIWSVLYARWLNVQLLIGPVLVAHLWTDWVNWLWITWGFRMVNILLCQMFTYRFDSCQHPLYIAGEKIPSVRATTSTDHTAVP